MRASLLGTGTEVAAEAWAAPPVRRGPGETSFLEVVSVVVEDEARGGVTLTLGCDFRRHGSKQLMGEGCASSGTLPHSLAACGNPAWLAVVCPLCVCVRRL